MPQMAPTWWTMLFLLFLTLIMMTWTMMFFNKSNIISKSFMEEKKYTLNWKW